MKSLNIFYKNSAYSGEIKNRCFLFNEAGDGIENGVFPAADDEISREGMAKGLFQGSSSNFVQNKQGNSLNINELPLLFRILFRNLKCSNPSTYSVRKSYLQR